MNRPVRNDAGAGEEDVESVGFGCEEPLTVEKGEYGQELARRGRDCEFWVTHSHWYDCVPGISLPEKAHRDEKLVENTERKDCERKGAAPQQPRAGR